VNLAVPERAMVPSESTRSCRDMPHPVSATRRAQTPHHLAMQKLRIVIRVWHFVIENGY
jgi:hypothetical protein